MHPAVETAIDYLRRHVRPQAEVMDGDAAELRKALDGLAERGLLALKRPLPYGGPGIDEAAFRRFQEEVARTSGALAFLQTQHQSAVSMLAASAPERLKAEVLPHMHDGTRKIGIGFSQLRRSGAPLVRAEPSADGGLTLNGHVPWVTGWTFFPEFLVGATLPDGRAVFAIVPLASGSGVTVSEPMRLAVMDAARTVTVDFRDFVVPPDHVAFEKGPNWIRDNDQINIALQGHFAIGCAQAGIDLVRDAAERKPFDFLTVAADRLQNELDRCRAETAEAQGIDRERLEETTPERLRVRAWAIELAVRCAHAAIAAHSGAANSKSHPAQRVYREALVYTVSAQTPPIMEATLERLTTER